MRPLSLKVDSKRLPVSTQGEYLQYTESVCNMVSFFVGCEKGSMKDVVDFPSGREFKFVSDF